VSQWVNSKRNTNKIVTAKSPTRNETTKTEVDMTIQEGGRPEDVRTITTTTEITITTTTEITITTTTEITITTTTDKTTEVETVTRITTKSQATQQSIAEDNKAQKMNQKQHKMIVTIDEIVWIFYLIVQIYNV